MENIYHKKTSNKLCAMGNSIPGQKRQAIFAHKRITITFHTAFLIQILEHVDETIRPIAQFVILLNRSVFTRMSQAYLQLEMCSC